MKMFTRLQRQLYWLNVPTTLLIALLQRTPVLKLVSLAGEMARSSPLGAVLRSAFLGTVTLGAIDTMAGATQYTVSSPSPLSATVGTPITSVAFGIVGSLDGSDPDTYIVSGTMPPGLSFAGVTSGVAAGSSILMTGTPTTPGNYTFSILASSSQWGPLSFSYSYSVNVGGGGSPPAITAQPSSQSVTVGANVSFTAAASGTPAPTYQWQKDNVDIPGATATTLTLNNVQLGDAGAYTLVATNSGGSVSSNAAVLTVNAANSPPVITLNPVSQSAGIGGSVTFTAAASGNPAPTYQWRKDNVDIPGATSGTLTLNNVQLGDAATYTMVATNSVSSATTVGATLTVTTSAPAITLQPNSQTVYVGTNVTFTAAASGSPTPTYQWKKNGNDIPGATSGTLTLNNVQAGDAGSYTMVATNIVNSATTNAATLTVNPVPVAPSITLQPSSQSVLVGANVSFTSAASGTPAPTYQWKKNGTDIPGATTTTLTLNNVQLGDAGSYTMAATNSVSTATSNAATLTVNTALPTFTTQPVDREASPGGSPAFTVVVIGLPTPTVKWQRSPAGGGGWSDLANGGSYAGVTTATLTVSSLTLGMNGDQFRCVATNGNGSTTSNAVTLTVGPLVTGDFNYDRQKDIVWENTATGDRALWLMHGTVFIGGASLGNLSAAWRVAGSADFNGDGKTDILWENTVTGDRMFWLMDGPNYVSTVDMGIVPVAWRIAATADFNGDHKTDIMVENTTTGERVLWLMNGTVVSSTISYGTIPPQWRIAASADFNHDGQIDIVWENTQTGQHAIWLMNGTFFQSAIDFGSIPTEWRLATVGDFNSDNDPDFFWENTTTGDRALWLMHGTIFSSSIYFGIISTDWNIAP